MSRPNVRGKRSISISAKSKKGQAIIQKLVVQSDVLIDPFRPGVLGKLGLGPDEMLKLNPKLVYARMYGFESGSKYADMAGHDVNYAGLSGVLSVTLPGNMTTV
jgi:alpha-methylacyl-CoA racemase